MRWPPIFPAVAALAAVLLGVILGLSQPAENPRNFYQVSPPMPLADFQLKSADGQPFTLAKLRGRYSLVFSGYSRCPDICPATLSLLVQADQKFANTLPQQRPQLVFISVDPANDKPTVLQTYLGYFKAPVVGVTGTNQQLDRLLLSLGFYPSVQQSSPAHLPVLAHSGAVALVNPQAQVVGLLRAPITLASITSQVQQLIKAP